MNEGYRNPEKEVEKKQPTERETDGQIDTRVKEERNMRGCHRPREWDRNPETERDKEPRVKGPETQNVDRD